MRMEIEVPEEFSIEFENAIKSHYANRSEAIRDSMRLLIDKLEEKQGLGKIATRVYYAIKGEKRRTKSGVFVCPLCGNEHWSVSVEEDGSAKCTKCGKVMASHEEDIDKLLVEKEVDGYICPICGLIVEDTPLNYSGNDTIDGKMAILCPRLHNFVNGLPLLHHGSNFGEFETKMSGTDYFFAYHKPCRNKQNRGFCDIYAVLIDNTGRVILDLQCQDCKAVDAKKTQVLYGTQGIERIFLSPKLRSRIGKHPWDDV